MVEEKKQIVEAKVVDVTTETTPMIQIGTDIHTINEVITKMYNDIQLLKRGLL